MGGSGLSVGPGMVSPQQAMFIQQAMGGPRGFSQQGAAGILQGPLAYLEKTTSNIGEYYLIYLNTTKWLLQLFWKQNESKTSVHAPKRQNVNKSKLQFWFSVRDTLQQWKCDCDIFILKKENGMRRLFHLLEINICICIVSIIIMTAGILCFFKVVTRKIKGAWVKPPLMSFFCYKHCIVE